MPGRLNFRTSMRPSPINYSNHLACNSSAAQFLAPKLIPKYRHLSLNASEQLDPQTAFTEDAVSPSSAAKMSNHLLLKPSSSGSLARENDFRITGPNVELNQVRTECHIKLEYFQIIHLSSTLAFEIISFTNKLNIHNASFSTGA